MKKAVIGILGHPPLNQNYHGAGMVNIVSQLFNAQVEKEGCNYENYDQLIIYHGPNFDPKQYNAMGGINHKVKSRAAYLARYQGEVLSLDGFQLSEFAERKKVPEYANYPSFKLTEIPERENLVIGDSHSISVWPGEDYTIKRHDGKTMHGFMKDPYKYADYKRYKHIIFYFGNIDLRFHFCRNLTHGQRKDLVFRYLDFASKYNSTVVELLPVENESRKLPTTMIYKGKKYFGSIKERQEVREQVNEWIRASGLNYYSWPKFMVNRDGELDFKYMEPKGSVHLRPKYYYHKLMKKISEPTLFNV